MKFPVFRRVRSRGRDTAWKFVSPHARRETYATSVLSTWEVPVAFVELSRSRQVSVSVRGGPELTVHSVYGILFG